ncbi:Rho termination factor N-terminal domain-containing protein [Leifsonia virtsii]|uniref:Rho termination factor N-terminal domain-containing protein n=1 Tax=Leifsonia virtsii TaxID=3035915 RepID=A0ABT8J311_9MICO|nr:Rho termination factor N-terminal domain-containing protein [Leifsonia virtsii]MDN4598619.1 Rho termination factor N-terminal domain-containing protein [Leifsonia virtsii]
MAKRKKLEKAAEKAFARAEEAVGAARKAAAKLDSKKAEKRARKLERELAELVGRDTRDAADPGAPESAPVDLTPPLPSVHDDTVEDAAEFAGSAATSAPHDPELDGLTVQALRDVARARGLRNVSKLTKGQLIERLSE